MVFFMTSVAPVAHRNNRRAKDGVEEWVHPFLSITRQESAVPFFFSRVFSITARTASPARFSVLVLLVVHNHHGDISGEA